MQNVTKLLSDIFSMGFDIVIPISGIIIAVMIGLVIFLIRYYSYCIKRNRYERFKHELSTEDNYIGKPALEPVIHNFKALPEQEPLPQQVHPQEANIVCDKAVAALLMGAAAKRTRDMSANGAVDKRFAEEIMSAACISHDSGDVCCVESEVSL